jgi:YbbR domain-containing protein
MKIKNFLFKNPGLRLLALFLAVLVWIIITGKERAYSEKTIDVIVEYFGMSANIDIRSVNPDKVRVKIQATSNVLAKIGIDDFKLRIDLSRITESTRLNVFSEDFLYSPSNVRVLSIHPRMIEVTTAELFTRDIPVKIHYIGVLKSGVRLLERRVVPEKVRIVGYKSQIMSLSAVETDESINLGEISDSRTMTLTLKKVKEIIKFVDFDKVELSLVVANDKKDKE